MASEVEIILKARNEANAAFNSVLRQLSSVQTAAQRSGAVMKAQFRDAASAVSSLSPQVAALQSQLSALATLAASPIGLLAGAIVAVGTAAAGAVGAAKSLADQVERLGNLSASTGASIQSLQVLGEVFNRAGLGSDAANASLLRLNKAIAEQNPLLAELGVTAREPVEALLQISRAFATSTDEAAKTRVAFELMGRGSGDVLKVIDGLAQKFPELRAEMASTGQLISGPMVEAAERFDERWDTIAGRFAGAMMRIKGAALETIEALDRFAQKVVAVAPSLVATAAQIAASWNPLVRVALGLVRGAFATEQVGEAAKVAAPKAQALAKSVDLVAAAAASMDKKAKEAKRSIEDLLSHGSAFPLLLPGLRDVLPGKPATPLGPGEEVEEPELRLTGFGQSIQDEMTRADQAVEGWKQSLADLANATQASVALQQIAFQGLSNVFGLFANALVTGANLTKVRVVDAFREMVSQVLQELARLALAKLFKFVLSVVGGPVGAAAGGLGGGFTGGSFTPAAALSPGAAAPSLASAGGIRNSNVTLNVSALDARSFTEQLVSPFGSVRRALGDAATLGAY